MNLQKTGEIEYDYNHLNLQQKEIFDNVVAKIHKDENVKTLILGSAGTGKSYLINTIINTFKKENEFKLVVTTLTGVASESILNAKTIHSFFKLNNNLTQSNVLIKDNNGHFQKYYYKIENSRPQRTFKVRQNNIDKQSIKPPYFDLKKTNIFIIDEISLISCELFLILNRIIKDIFKSKKIFANLKCLFFGDFLQLPPIQGISLINNELLVKYFNAFFLNVPIRNDDVLFKICENIRNLNLQDVYEVFRERDIKNFEPSAYENSVHIYSTKRICDFYNEKKNKELNQQEHIFDVTSKDNPFITENGIDTYNDEVNNISKKLTLCVGSLVMVTKNLSSMIKNGTTGIVKEIHNDKIVIVIKNLEYDIFPFTETLLDNKDNIKYQLTNFPLKLAWAITIHKSQGLTFNSIFISLYDFFDYRLFYVAISRVKKLENIYIDFVSNEIDTRKIKEYFMVLENYNDFCNQLQLVSV